MANAIVPNQEALKTLSAALTAKKDYLAKCLPKHLTAERVIKVAIIAASRTPQLLQCTPQSFVLAVVQASQLGLEAGSPLGEAYLVPYKQECTLIVGYRGLIALARRSGEIESIEAHVVHAKDAFRVSFGLDAVLEHSPWMPMPTDEDLRDENHDAWQEKARPGPMVAVYAVARLKGGARQAEVMSRAEVDAIRRRSRASGAGPWVTDYEEMAKKTVVRRLAKYLPMSIEMANALDADDRQERGDVIDVSAGIDLAAPPQLQRPQTATDKMKAQLGASVPKPAPREPGDDGDDEPPPFPTGTDGGPRGSNDVDAQGGGAEGSAGAGAQAMARPLEELRAHLAGKPRGGGGTAELAEIVASWSKRRAALIDEGLGDEAFDVVREELRSRGCGDPDRFIAGVQGRTKRTVNG
jgi:recombination protein RecT